LLDPVMTFANSAVAASLHRSSGGLAAPTGTRAIATRGLAITSPPDGATYLRDPTLRGEFQTLALRAQADVDGRLTWSVDDVTVGVTTPDGAFDWPLQLGRHALRVTDASGRSAEARIEIR
jgi:membrane carboxypeptidase/penicillin-binding protein PbpC